MSDLETIRLGEPEAKAARERAGYVVRPLNESTGLTHAQAIAESRRLARENPGVSFGVFALERSSTVATDG